MEFRVLSERTFERVGANKPITVDVRIVAATNKNLRQLVAKGEFRDDLFFRLNVVSIPMPPLRTRAEDIVLLTSVFLKEFAAENNKPTKFLTDEALNLLRQYQWPGNVRELRTAIEHGVVMSNAEVIGIEHLPKFQDDPSPSPAPIISAKHVEKQEKPLASEHEFNLHVQEMHTIQQALQFTEGNRTEAARLLGISRRTLQRKLKDS
ncbi:MAG: sigma 54-interacting transcriptional regulator [Akkermansiaceae bacterium]